LRKARIAIAGLGGVGGAHLLALARLGTSHLNIADFDVHNLNRQAGAFMPFMGQSKLDPMARMAQDINPEIDQRLFPQGVQPDNIDGFLRDVDVYVDALDFFMLPARRLVFAKWS
jgi:tRNA A37 threonylcarbamoyladenosine dehydratase